MDWFIACVPFVAYWITCVCTLPLSQPQLNDRDSNRVIGSRQVFLHTFVSSLGSIPFYYLLCQDRLFPAGLEIRWGFLLAGVWMVDTVEYIWHYTVHHCPYLMRFHAVHHQIHRPYGHAAWYQSTMDSVTELIGMTLVFWMCGYRYEEFVVVMTLAVVATVCEHVGEKSFHGLHHSTHPHCNFQQPFFSYYDYWFGTLAK